MKDCCHLSTNSYKRIKESNSSVSFENTHQYAPEAEFTNQRTVLRNLEKWAETTLRLKFIKAYSISVKSRNTVYIELVGNYCGEQVGRVHEAALLFTDCTCE